MTTPRTDDTAPIPWAETHTVPYAARPEPHEPSPPSLAGPAAEPDAPAATRVESAAPATAPALNPPTWSGRKTAIAAALAIGISSMGAVAAAAALPAGSSAGGGQGQFQRGGTGPGGQVPGGQMGGQLPGAGTGQPGTGQQGTGQQGGPSQLGGVGVPQEPGSRTRQSPTDPNASTT